MASRMSFTQHIAVTTPQIQRYQTLLFCSAIATTVSLSSAFFGREVLPAKVRSLLLITSTLASTTATLGNEGLQRSLKQQQPYIEAQQRQIESLNASQEYIEDTRQRAIAARDAISAVLEESPNEFFTIGFLKQEGLLDLLTGGEDVIQGKGKQTPPHSKTVSPKAIDTAATPTYPGAMRTSKRTKLSILEKIPEEDLAQTMAQSTADPSCATSILIAAQRRCGKSNLLRQAIAFANNLHNTQIDFLVWNAGKDDENYCGLENDADYLFTAHPENIEWAVTRLMGDVSDWSSKGNSGASDDSALVRRCDRWIGYPTILIGDEWNNTLLAAANADMLLSKPIYRKMLISGSTQIVTRGPGKLVLGWFTSHSAYVKNVGWDEDIKKNLFCIAIARIGRNEQGQIIKFGESMKQALGGKGGSGWIGDPDLAKALKARFDDWFASEDEAVVALTNLLGEWRLIRLPKYPDQQPLIQRWTMNQSINELTQ